MEKEYFLSGYCRASDQSRIVTLVTEDGDLTQIDCSFETCVHAPSCEIARKIREALTENQ